LDGTDDKVVIFCRFTASIDRVKAICEKKKLRTVVYDGRSKGPTWQIFRDGKADVIVAQYAAGGPGLNLQISSTMVMYEPCFSTLDWDQATSRIRRIGQRKVCRYLLLTTPDTIEAQVYDSVLNGISVTEDMLKRWTLNNDI
jgi:SNF2 family DNA or RNA helicase